MGKTDRGVIIMGGANYCDQDAEGSSRGGALNPQAIVCIVSWYFWSQAVQEGKWEKDFPSRKQPKQRRSLGWPR